MFSLSMVGGDDLTCDIICPGGGRQLQDILWRSDLHRTPWLHGDHIDSCLNSHLTYSQTQSQEEADGR